MLVFLHLSPCFLLTREELWDICSGRQMGMFLHGVWMWVLGGLQKLPQAHHSPSLTLSGVPQWGVWVPVKGVVPGILQAAHGHLGGFSASAAGGGGGGSSQAQWSWEEKDPKFILPVSPLENTPVSYPYLLFHELVHLYLFLFKSLILLRNSNDSLFFLYMPMSSFPGVLLGCHLGISPLLIGEWFPSQ